MKKIIIKAVPLFVVIVLALVVVYKNVDVNRYYAGWDNILAEFDLGRYARQVLGGAWVEHQGLGAPAAQAQLADAVRLPVLWFLKIMLPENLVRQVFIFSMYVVGGVGSYLYLERVWIGRRISWLRPWLAGLGAIFYLLGILTLQQFYIAFEMFTVQFALLPFVLLVVDRLAREPNRNNLVWFGLVQVLSAPSGHQPVLFYLGVMFAVVYGLAVGLKRGLVGAISTAFLVGLVTLVTNAYWILPNLYYGINNAQYVQESRENLLFGPESVWSVRQASNLTNFLQNTHYLFEWKDYSFEKQEHEYIFDEWQSHLARPEVTLMLMGLSVATLVGMVVLIFDKEKGSKRWGVLVMYAFCLAFIWIDLFPTRIVLDWLYQSKSFWEAFRNTFTKLSIIYSFVLMLLLIEFVESLVVFLRLVRRGVLMRLVAVGLVIGVGGAIVFAAKPAFEGHFISEKLRVSFPGQYWELFAYLGTRSENLRVLELPQLGHVGWEYYDWQFLGKGNGYQGMGFYQFGFPQPFLNRDSDRWVETSDFFYHELEYALDKQDVGQFGDILRKYRIDLVVVDETRVDPSREHDYASDKKIVTEVGLKRVWHKDFLTVYERISEGEVSEIVAVPGDIKQVLVNNSRIREDYVYGNGGDYMEVGGSGARVVYPFLDLTRDYLDGVVFTSGEVEISRNVPRGDYELSLPGLKGDSYETPVKISFSGREVAVEFPTYSLGLGGMVVNLPTIGSTKFMVTSLKDPGAVTVFVGNRGFLVNRGEEIQPVVRLVVDSRVAVGYSRAYRGEDGLPLKEVVGSGDYGVIVLDPDWESFRGGVSFKTGVIEKVIFWSDFPAVPLDLEKNKPVNCEDPKRGTIATYKNLDEGGLIYKTDDFGVNCGGYNPDFLSPAYGYILRVVGRNLVGRGIKAFVNYSGDVSTRDYIWQDAVFDKYIALSEVSTRVDSKFYFNWETRSHGGKSVNELGGLSMAPFPLTWLAQLGMEKKMQADTVGTVRVISDNKFLDSIHVIGAGCGEAKCYLGLDQSYDDLWLALEWGKWQLLPHYRYDGWANTWEVGTGEGKYVVFYLPELVVMASFIILVLVACQLLWPREKKHFYDPVVEKLHPSRIPRINFLRK